MVDNWESFWEEADNIDIDKKAEEIDKIFLDVFSKPEGERMLEYLKERYLDNDIAYPHDDLIQIGIRQGKATLIRDIIRAIQRAKDGYEPD